MNPPVDEYACTAWLENSHQCTRRATQLLEFWGVAGFAVRVDLCDEHATLERDGRADFDEHVGREAPGY